MLETQIQEHVEESDRLFAQIKQKALYVETKQDLQAKQRETFDEREMLEDIINFEKQVQLQHLQSNKNLRRQQEANILKELDEKSFQLSLELTKIKKGQEEK